MIPKDRHPELRALAMNATFEVAKYDCLVTQAESLRKQLAHQRERIVVVLTDMVRLDPEVFSLHSFGELKAGLDERFDAEIDWVRNRAQACFLESVIDSESDEGPDSPALGLARALDAITETPFSPSADGALLERSPDAPVGLTPARQAVYDAVPKMADVTLGQIARAVKGIDDHPAREAVRQHVMHLIARGLIRRNNRKLYERVQNGSGIWSTPQAVLE